jgi:uncharacterized protein (TIGR02147 family)
MDIFSYKDYRSYLQDFVKARTEFSQKDIAAAMSISPSLLSQVLTGDRELNSDQAYRFASWSSLNFAETSYFLLMLDHHRAATAELKRFFEERLVRAAEEYRNNERVRLDLKKTGWTQDFMTLFYSSWHSVAVYCLLGLKKTWSLGELSERLLLEEFRIQQIMAFFLRYDIVEKTDESTYTLKQTNYSIVAGIEEDFYRSVAIHNCKNLRAKAMDTFEKHQFIKDFDSTFLTITALISETDFQEFRSKLKDLVADFHQKIAKEKFEQVACLNIDFFKI